MRLIKTNKFSILSNKLSILVRTILVHAILVQRYSCKPNILNYIIHSNVKLTGPAPKSSGT